VVAWRRHREFLTNSKAVTATEGSALTAHSIEWEIIIEYFFSQPLIYYLNNDAWLSTIDVGYSVMLHADEGKTEHVLESAHYGRGAWLRG
jgi:hypothetical protein